ncbi:MAG: sugar ABC transporter substrate-binding protein [Alphaproteobacteria bacterium]|nr:sugar ABC transporter substrate-binding protein [Alphaproteobacteria bacterium]
MTLYRKSVLTVSALAMSASAALADITILAWPGGAPEESLRALVEQYNETKGAEIGSKAELLYFSRDNFFDKMLSDVAAGSTEFDVMLTATYNVGKYAPFMEPIDDLITDDLRSVFPQSAIDSQSFEGRFYGIPTDLGVHFLYYRTDLIDQLLSDAAWQGRYAEISEEFLGTAMQPKAPGDWTWDDFMASALFFTKSINPDSPVRYGTVLQLKNLLFNVMIWQGIAASYGGDWLDADGNITVDSDAYRKALALYKRLVELEATPADSLSYEYAEANGAFGTGRVAFYTQWSAAYASLVDEEEYPAIAGKFDILHQPAGSEGIKTHFHALGLGINAASEKKDEARAFLSYLGSEEAMKMYIDGGGQPPVVGRIVEEVAGDRPDMVAMSSHAGDYGHVMAGGTSASALDIYTNQAENFTGYWAGQFDIDTAISNVEAFMAGEFDK